MKGIRWLNKSRAHKVTAVIGAGILLQSITIQAATIEDISFSALPNEQFEIKLGFDGQAVEPKGYTVESPARIVLDFEGTESALPEKKYALSFDNGESAVVLSAGGRTRMIVNLKTPVPYEVAVNEGSLTLLVGNKASVGTTGQGSGSQVSSSAGSSTGTIAIRQTENTVENVDFSRGEAGQGIVSIALANAATPIDVSREGSLVVLSFYHTTLPEALDRKLDVIDFSTPIKTIDSTSDGATTRVVIETVGEYDYLAYQADGQYVVSVQPLTKEALADLKSKFEFSGEKLSLNFQDIEVRSVLQLIADFTGLNLVASDTVTGSITLRLENVPWDQALEIVLKAKGLDKRQQGNVLMVAPAVEIAEQERLQVEANKQIIELAPLVTDFVRVRYADARELFDLFNVRENSGGGDDENATSSILSARGTAIVDERTNTIILTDVQEKIDGFRILIGQIDTPIRQVEIEARIVTATLNYRKEIGTRWGISGIRRPNDDILSFAGTRQAQKADGVIDAFTISSDEITVDALGNVTIDNESDLTLAETLAVDLGASQAFGSLSLGLLKDNTMLDLELSAMEDDGFGEIVARPTLITGDKQAAIIKSGTEIPYQTGTSSGETDLEFREAVLKLEVQPQITPDNRIIMDLSINQDTVGQIVPTSEGGSEPTIDVTEIQTQVLVGDGQTLVLGGIFQSEEVRVVQKVPVLGDIPYIGRLFRNDLKDKSSREILIFITPRIINDALLDQ
ncbi:MAG: type IV pilus secretin PilQ [Porticoccaceae bacterium]|nr:type IV pilus secretin PilQ [Porticoccaceae bacterium]